MATLFGDTNGTLSGTQTGGAQSVTGTLNQNNNLHGDAASMIDSAKGGNDTVTGGANDSNSDLRNDAFGDAFSMAGSSIGGDDTVVGGLSSGSGDLLNQLHGDASAMSGSAKGGNDTVIGSKNSGSGKGTNFVFGDGLSMIGATLGGNDTVMSGITSGSGDAENVLLGESFSMAGSTKGGNDVVTGSVNTGSGHILSNFHGESSTMAGSAAGGDDTVTGDSNSGSGTVENFLYGDAFSMTDLTTGGDDIVIGGSNTGSGHVSNTVHGDTSLMSGSAIGGDDVITGGANSGSGTLQNVLYGDAFSITGSAKGGNDRLVSGLRATDLMFGDAQSAAPNAGGQDTFVFGGAFGVDSVFDFRQSQHDQLEFNVDGVDDMADLAISRVGNDTVITASPQDRVTLVGFTGQLTASDFRFPSVDETTSYVLFGRSSTAPGERNHWIGSGGANSQPSSNPHTSARASSFNADTVTTAGTVLAGSAAGDYSADGILTKSTVSMFNLTEASPGVFATGAAADLNSKIALGVALFGATNTKLDAAHSQINLASEKLHLALTDQNWNGIKNLEIKLDSDSSIRDIRLENFVDTRLKIGDVDPVGGPSTAFNVDIFGVKRGEIDASQASAGITLDLEIWSNGTNPVWSDPVLDVRGSAFGDAVTVRPGVVIGSAFGDPPGLDPDTKEYRGNPTSAFVLLGAGNNSYDAAYSFDTTSPQFTIFPNNFLMFDFVWGGSGSDFIRKALPGSFIFGDYGSGDWIRVDPVDIGAAPGNDTLIAAGGGEWIEGGPDNGQVVVLDVLGADLIVNGSFEEFDRSSDNETVRHNSGKWFTFREQQIDNIPGWYRPGDGGPIELQTNAVRGIAAKDGQIKLELDSHFELGGNAFGAVSQDITPITGLRYQVSFAYAPRPGAAPGSSQFSVTYSDEGGAVFSEFFSNRDAGWHVFSKEIIAGGTGTLTIQPEGTLDTFGALIDDVHFHEVQRVVSGWGDFIDCGTIIFTHFGGEEVADASDDLINVNDGDGFDFVRNFRPSADFFGGDVVRIENKGTLTMELAFSPEGEGLLIENDAGAVFLLGVLEPLGQSVQGNYLLLT